MASIPIAGDLADVIGSFAERVENRSLLLDKFPFHKQWGLGDLKAHEAHRWTLLRVCDGGPAVLMQEAKAKERAGRSPANNPEKAQKLRIESDMASRLAVTRVETSDLVLVRSRHTRRLIHLFRRTFSDRAVIAIGQLEGRLAINLADSLIQNAGISLDRLFGMPFIAGSAIKGACRHAALGEIKAVQGSERTRLFDAFREVFGTADTDFSKGDLAAFEGLLGSRSRNLRGGVAFASAYPLNEARVVADITNVHYPEYYRTGQVDDLAREKPQPNCFPAIEMGAQFAFCLVITTANSDSFMTDCVRRWLESALTVRGLGAKTSAGYGWFSLQPSVLEQIEAEERAAEAEAEAKAASDRAATESAKAEAARIAAMPPAEAARERFLKLGEQELAKQVSDLSTLSGDEQKGLLLALLSAQGKDAWKRWKKSDKPASKARVDALLTASKAHGIQLT
jgi:CRISPR type III-B/RAMP module RAMP protein Cmr6